MFVFGIYAETVCQPHSEWHQDDAYSVDSASRDTFTWAEGTCKARPLGGVRVGSAKEVFALPPWGAWVPSPVR